MFRKKRVPRVGTNPNTQEIKLERLHAIHGVPRRQVPPDHVEYLASLIEQNGYDLSKPITAIKMPNGDLIIQGGHHRVAAMRLLGEKTAPTEIDDYQSFINDRARLVYLTWLLAIGELTGYYAVGYFGQFYQLLDARLQKRVDSMLNQWQQNNL